MKLGRGITPTEAIDRGLLILAIVWQGAWLAIDPSLWPVGHAPVVNALLALSLFAWVALVLTGFGPLAGARANAVARYVDVAVLLAASVALLLQNHGIAAGMWHEGASLVNLTAGLIGLLLIAPIAAPLLVVLVIGEFALLTLRGSLGLPVGDIVDTSLYALYALAIGSGAIGGRRGIGIAAARSERANEEARAARMQADVLAELQLGLARQQRLLHETVLNTLTAVSLGGGSTAEIRASCTESLEVLHGISASGAIAGKQTSAWALADLTKALANRGIVFVIEMDDTDELPHVVQQGIHTALRETLLNTLRHARASQVKVRGHFLPQRPGTYLMTISDNGVGFDGSKSNSRFGINESIVRSMEEIGGTAEIVSRLGEGTTVTLCWTPPKHQVDRVQTLAVASSRAFVVPVLVSFGVFTFFSMLSTLSASVDLRLTLGAFTLALALGALLIWRSRYVDESVWGFEAGWLVVLVCVAAPSIYWLQVRGAGVPGTVWSNWASEVIIALLIVVVVIGPWWSWLPALLSWVYVQGALLELLRPGSALIVAAALFANSVRRNVRAYLAASEQIARDEAAIVAGEEALRRLNRRNTILRSSGASELLEGLATGRLEPTNKVVMASCAQEERFIRSIMVLDPAADSLHALAAELAVSARRRGVALDIDVGEPEHIAAGKLARLQFDTAFAIANALPGEPARLSARREGDAFVVRCVCVLEPDGKGVADCLPAGPGEYAVFIDPENTMLIEARFDGPWSDDG